MIAINCILIWEFLQFAHAFFLNNFCFSRMLLGKVPDGHYKLSREAVLAAELPTTFTARSNWRGPLPRDLLCVFCRQHRLLEPLFSVKSIDPSETLKSKACKKINLPRVAGEGETTNGHIQAAHDQNLDKPTTYQCEVKILSRRHDVILECTSDNTYKKESDAIQNAALKVLTWFSKYFKQLDMPTEKLASFGLANCIIIHPRNFSLEFSMLGSIYGVKKNYQSDLKQENAVILVNVEGDDSGVFPSPGSLTCINYAVTLTREGEPTKELIESKDEFEFEVGAGAVINQLEAGITQLSVNQAAQFITSLPSRDLILAAAGECAENLASLSLCECHATLSSFYFLISWYQII